MNDANFEEDKIFGFGLFVDIIVLNIEEFEFKFFRYVCKVFVMIWRRVHKVNVLDKTNFPNFYLIR